MSFQFKGDLRGAVEYAFTCGLMNRYGNSWRAGVNFEGHGFWIHAITTERGTFERKVVSGQISHILQWRPDDQIYFTLTFTGDRAELTRLDVSRGGVGAVLGPLEGAFRTIATYVQDYEPVAGTVALAQLIDSYYTGTWQSVANMILAWIVADGLPAFRLRWSYSGAFRPDLPFGFVDVPVEEPTDPHAWTDNHLLVENVANVDWRWSYSGPIAGWTCVQVNEPADPDAWQDNYLCYAPDFGVDIAFSNEGPLLGYHNLQMIEPSDPYTWADNFLAWRKRRLTARGITPGR